MSEWTVRKRAGALLTGDRFIFSEDLGGEGQALTVNHILTAFGTVEIHTDELDFSVDTTQHTMVMLAGEDDA